MARDPIDQFVTAYSEAIHDQNAAVFAGAGLSIPAGLVDWKGLLREIAEDVGLDVDREQDLITVAQYHFNDRGRHKINQSIVRGFADRAQATENHAILSSLPIQTYWTTNYDTLIEEALRAAGKTPDVKATVKNLATNVPRRDAVVFKMHGDVSQPDKAVVTKDDYELYGQSRQLFSTALRGDLVAKTFLFVGFSFTDPNLDQILARIRVLLDQDVRHHYCLMRRVQRSDFATKREFDYARVKQDLQVRDLRRYGIIGLLVNTYKDYTVVLDRVRQRFRRSRVFISGSAASYAPWPAAKAQRLIHEIAEQLVADRFTVVSGFGVGVGEYVINGVMSALGNEKTRLVDERLVLRPFPMHLTDPAVRKKRWTEYREQLLDEAGSAVFLFGNKAGDVPGGVKSADGVAEEFALAIKKGLAVVPVGCTGSVAETAHVEVTKNLAKYYPKPGYTTLLKGLGKVGPVNVVASKVVKLLQKLRDEA